MKKYLYNTKKDLVEYSIDVITFVNDARIPTLNNLPVTAASSNSEDYDSYSIEELMDLDTSVLRTIDSFYALDNLLTAIQEYGFDYKLTSKQSAKLSTYLKNRELSSVQLTKDQIKAILDSIKKCNHIVGPNYRPNQPEKNFAEVHGLDMVPADYLAILKSVKPEECIGAVKSADTRRLGTLLYEFIHDPKNYKLKYSGQQITDDIKIYIKILPDYENDLTIAIISFHDPED